MVFNVNSGLGMHFVSCTGKLLRQSDLFTVLWCVVRSYTKGYEGLALWQIDYEARSHTPTFTNQDGIRGVQC